MYNVKESSWAKSAHQIVEVPQWVTKMLPIDCITNLELANMTWSMLLPGLEQMVCNSMHTWAHNNNPFMSVAYQAGTTGS